MTHKAIDCLVNVHFGESLIQEAKTASALDHANIHCNKNMIPFDPKAALVTSGIRLGSPAATTRGMGKEEFVQILR